MKRTFTAVVLGLSFTLSGMALPFEAAAYDNYATTAAPLPFPYTYVPPASDQTQTAPATSAPVRPVTPQSAAHLVAPQFPSSGSSSVLPVANVQARPLPPMPAPVSVVPSPVLQPDTQPFKTASADPYNLPKKDPTARTINDVMLPQDSSDTAKPAVEHAWAQEIELLERENRALRDRLLISDNDSLKDIRVDSVSQIREDVLRARVVELEKQLDRLQMRNNPGDLPDKTSATILAAPPKIH